MAEAKKIYCPKCNSHVGTYDGKSSVNFVTRCNKCRKRVIYDIATGETRIKELPARATSSGMTF